MCFPSLPKFTPFIICIFAAPLAAQTQVNATWNGSFDTNWSNFVNWSYSPSPNPLAPPNNNANYTYAVGVGGSLTLNQAATVDTVTITGGGALSIDDGRSLTLATDGSLNNGTLALLSSNSVSTLAFQVAGTLNGTGTIQLSDSPNNQILASNTTITFGSGQSLTGAGRLLANGGGLLNFGSITATGINSLRIDPNATLNFTNQGTLIAQGAGGIVLEAGDHINTGFSIDVESGSRLVLAASSILTGGTLTTAATGFVEASNAATINGVTLDGRMVVGNGRTLTNLNNLVNNGRIDLEGDTGIANLSFNSADQTLSGSGEVVLSDSINNRILSPGFTLTLATTQQLRGSGSLLANGGGMINYGTITATGFRRSQYRPGKLLLLSQSRQSGRHRNRWPDLQRRRLPEYRQDHRDPRRLATPAQFQLSRHRRHSPNHRQRQGGGRLNQPNPRRGDTRRLADRRQRPGHDPAERPDQQWIDHLGRGDRNKRPHFQRRRPDARRHRHARAFRFTQQPHQQPWLRAHARSGPIAHRSRATPSQCGGMASEGDISATGTAALVIDPGNSFSFANLGSLTASGTGGLTFNAGDFQNTGNVIEILDGSQLLLNSSSVVTGGTLQTTGSGKWWPAQPTKPRRVTLDGSLIVPTGRGMTLRNGLTNNGSITLKGRPEQASSLSAAATRHSAAPARSSFRFTQQPHQQPRLPAHARSGQSLTGAGQLLLNSGGMVSEGGINATGTAAPRHRPREIIFLCQSRQPHRLGSRRLTFNAGDFQNTGNVIEILDGSQLLLNSSSVVTGGVLQTTGSGKVVAGSTSKPSTG